jgi:hypothetical protein
MSRADFSTAYSFFEGHAVYDQGYIWGKKMSE